MCFLLAYGRKPRFNIFNLFFREDVSFGVQNEGNDTIRRMSVKLWEIRKSHSEITRYGTYMFYQRITFGSVTDTNGPSTRKCSPNWQLHLWQRGTTYQCLSFESPSCTCAPSIACCVQPNLWHLFASIPVAFFQYVSQLPFLLPSLRFNSPLKIQHIG